MKKSLVWLILFVLGCGGKTTKLETPAPTPIEGENLSECESYAASDLVVNTLKLWRGRVSHPEVWPGLSFKDDVLVFRKSEGTCFVVATETTQELIEIATPVELPTPVFWFFVDVSPATVAEPLQGFAGMVSDEKNALFVELRKREVKRALILNTSLDDAVTSSKTMSAFGALEEILAMFAIHEGTHLNAMYPVWFNSGKSSMSWPTWDAQPDLGTVLSKCYGVAESSQEKEWNALFLALKAKGSPAEFVKARKSRYSMRNETLPDFRGEPHDCAAAEGIMELEEGGADYLTFRLAMEGGWVTRDEMLSYLSTRWKDKPHYAFGMAQLFFIFEKTGSFNPDVLNSPTSLLETVASL